MRTRLPKELGDALLVAAGVMTLALFVALYVMLPSTSIDVQSFAQTIEPQSPDSGEVATSQTCAGGLSLSCHGARCAQ